MSAEGQSVFLTDSTSYLLFDEASHFSESRVICHKRFNTVSLTSHPSHYACRNVGGTSTDPFQQPLKCSASHWCASRWASATCAGVMRRVRAPSRLAAADFCLLPVEWATARVYHKYARTSSCDTPSPVAYMSPRLNSASASRCAAAFSYHFVASA